MTPVMYPASFFFKEPSTAYIFLIVINLFTGITCIVSSFLLEIFSYDEVSTADVCQCITILIAGLSLNLNLLNFLNGIIHLPFF